MVNLGSIWFAEPVSVCGPGHFRTNKMKLGRDNWVAHCVREANTCQRTIRIRTLSSVNNLVFHQILKQMRLCSIYYPCNSFQQYSYPFKHFYCLVFSSPEDSQYLKHRSCDLYFFQMLKPQLWKHSG